MSIKERFHKIRERKWNRRFIILTAIVLVLCIPMRCGGPYKGRVVDRETGRPIVGVVAVASWRTVIPHIAGGTSQCQDADEAVTNQNGEFIIKGTRGLVFGLFTGEMFITVYKVGYKPVLCHWEYFEEPGCCFNEGGEILNDRAIFPLKRVYKDRLRFEGDPPFVSCGRKNGKPLVGYIKARKEYRKAMGYKDGRR